MDDVRGALVTCKFCGSKVDLGAEALARAYQVPVTRTPPPIRVSDPHAAPHVAPPVVRRAPAPPSPFWGRLKIASGPLLGLAAGWAGVLCLFAHLGNGQPRPIPAALLMGIAVIFGAVSGRKIPAMIAAVWAGGLLAAKPFMRPVFMKDGDFFGPTSETHLNYIVPGVMFLATAAIIAMTLRSGGGEVEEGKEKKNNNKTKPLFHALNAAGLAAGIALAIPMFGGETTKDVIERYKPRFEALRGSLRTIHGKLPPPGSLKSDQYRPNLTPMPVFDNRTRSKTNTALVPPEHLLDMSAKPAHDLIISTDLTHSLAWTGPNNPLSESVLYDRAGEFDQTLERALAYRYIVVYRPAMAGLEVFVFDLKTTDLLASFRMKDAGDFTQSRLDLGKALEKATGGAFAIDR
jgi:hypothetical protein